MRLWLIQLLLLLALTSAQAQRDPMADLRFVPAGGTSAIVDSIVSSLTQDERGLLWVGTAVGLMRYDGYQTQAFPITDPGGGPGNRFLRTLLADGPVLWAGGDAEGLARFDTLAERWSLYRHDPARPDSISPGSVFKMARAPDGRIWLSMLAGLDCLDPATGRFEHHRVADGRGLPDDRIGSLLFDRRGDLWVGTWRGVARRRAGSDRFESVGGELLRGSAIDALAEGPGDRIWAGARDGRLMLIEPASGEATLLETGETGEAGMGASQVITLLKVNGSEVWVGRTAGVEVRDPDGRLLQTLRPDRRKPGSLAGTVFHALLQDRAGTVWVGSYGGGLQRHHPGSDGVWVRKEDGDPTSPLADPDVRSVLQLDNGDVWLGTSGRGIAVLDARLRNITRIPPGGGFVGIVGALAQTPDGSVWVGGNNRGQVFRFDRERRLLAAFSTGHAGVRRLLGGRDGTLWIGTIEGLHRLAPGGAGPERVPLGEGERRLGNVNAIVEAPDGRLWVGGDKGLFRIVGGVLQPHGGGPGLPQTPVLGLLVDARGSLWIDTNQGLFRHAADSNGFEDISVQAGYGNRSFGANLLDDAQGRIWSQRGVYEPALRRFTEFDRIDGVDIGTGWFRSYAKLNDGRLLFGGSTGLLVVEPQRFQRWNFKPPLVATQLRIDNRELPAGSLAQGLTLAPPQRAFSVGFAALDFSAPLLNRYRYRLDGYDADWIPAQAEQRVASYANLPPGRYALLLQGSNRLGEWSEPPLTVAVEVLPTWWQTAWARGAGVALLALLWWTSWWVMQRRARARQRALEQAIAERTAELEASREALRSLGEHNARGLEDERKRVARELHDELGQQLAALRMEVSVVRSRAANGAPVERDHLDPFIVRLDRLVKTMRTLVSQLRPPALDGGLAPALQWLAAEFSQTTGVPCSVQVGTDVRELPADFAVMVFRIAQESLNNVRRHANASAAHVALSVEGDACVLTVRDDGVGFDTAHHRSGYGVLGMEERARLLGGELVVQSAPGHGTVVRLRFTPPRTTEV
jgi:signal transduction histidine kinase/ligand-binding sensor domain-containing protein